MDNRIYLHIDMNSYFASVEQQANPFLRGKPIAITGKHSDDPEQTRSVVTTASIEAKRLGVKTAMSTWQAKRICPSLILYPGDPEKYADITHRFNAIFQEFTHNVHQFSVDESFLDVTEQAKDSLGALYIAQTIRERLKEEYGAWITASIGIGPTKLMAKLAGESVKPNGLTIVYPDELLSFIDTRPLEDLCGIGPKMHQRLNELGLFTFKDIRACDPTYLQETFNSYGIWLYESAHGKDSSAILSSLEKSVFTTNSSSTYAPPKSVGHSYTLPHDTHDPLEIKRYLLALSDNVAWRLRRDGLLARRVKLTLRYSDFTYTSQQKLFQEPLADGYKIFQNAWSILKQIYCAEESVRLVGVSVSELFQGSEQQPLFLEDRKRSALTKALDTIQRRYGSSSWTRATLLHTKLKNRSSGFHFDHEQ